MPHDHVIFVQTRLAIRESQGLYWSLIIRRCYVVKWIPVSTGEEQTHVSRINNLDSFVYLGSDATIRKLRLGRNAFEQIGFSREAPRATVRLNPSRATSMIQSSLFLPHHKLMPSTVGSKSLYSLRILYFWCHQAFQLWARGKQVQLQRLPGLQDGGNWWHHVRRWELHFTNKRYDEIKTIYVIRGSNVLWLKLLWTLRGLILSLRLARISPSNRITLPCEF